MLAFRDFQLSKLTCDTLLSNFAFNCNLRHYRMASNDGELPLAYAAVGRCRFTPG